MQHRIKKVASLRAAAGLSAIVGCAPARTDEPEVECGSQAVIYDMDDRIELTQLSEPWRDELSKRVIALADQSLFSSLTLGELQTSDLNARSVLGLCPGERFAEQPVLAECTGFMLTQEYLLTAGHCLAAVDGCDDYVYLRNFAFSDEREDHVFDQLASRRCVEIADMKVDAGLDYALVRLEPASTSQDGPAMDATPAVGKRVVVASHPSGLPLKVDAEAIVSEASGGHVLIGSDTFVGSSGAPVYDESGSIFGMLVGGASDYEEDPAGHCLRSAHLSSKGLERVIPLADILASICEQRAELEVCRLPMRKGALPAPRRNVDASDGLIGGPSSVCDPNAHDGED